MPARISKSFVQIGSAGFGNAASTSGKPNCQSWSVAYVCTAIERSGVPCIGQLAGFWKAIRGATHAAISSLRFIGLWSVCAWLLLGFDGSQALAATYQLPTDRTNQWKGNVGVLGGIPDSSAMTQHKNATADEGADSTGATDAKAAIQAAIDSCPSNQVVTVSDGIYRLDSVLSFGSKPGAVFRFTNAIFRVNYAGPAFSTRRDITPDFHTNIACSIAKGSTNLAVWSTTNDIAVGRKISVRYRNNWQPHVWNASSISNTNNTMQAEFVITAVDGTNVTVDTPSPADFTVQSLQPHIGTRSLAPIKRVGIEQVGTGGQITNYSGTMLNGVQFVDAHNCWVKGVKISAAGTSSGAINVSDCTRVEVRRCWINRRAGTDDVYGISIGGTCTGIWVEDNIVDGMWPGIMVGEGGSVSGCAITFNYIRDPYVAGSTWIASGIGSHGGHTFNNLYEGDVSEGMVQFDGYHASISHQFFFRNHLQGAVSDAAYTDRRWAVDFCRYSYTNTLVGNVLGKTGYSWTLTTTNNGFTYEQFNLIYRLGYPGMGHQGYDSVRPPADYTSTDALDMVVTNSLLLHRNYDYANAAIVNLSGAETSLQDSFIYDEEPSWWGTNAWPAIGPDGATPIPAEDRFNSGGEAPPPAEGNAVQSVSGPGRAKAR
jgi:hypothetical protein